LNKDDYHMIVAGYILAVLGFIACFIGELRMLAIAYRRGFGWLLGCLLLAPLCWLLLLLVDFKSSARPFALAFFGLIAAGIGGIMAGIQFD
jgi:hypothetical protein